MPEHCYEDKGIIRPLRMSQFHWSLILFAEVFDEWYCHFVDSSVYGRAQHFAKYNWLTLLCNIV